MNVLSWIHHHTLTFKYMWKIFGARRRVTLIWTFRAGRKSNLSEMLCLSCISASSTKIRSKWLRRGGESIFPIISIRVLFVITTTALLQSAPKPNAAPLPPPPLHPIDATRHILLRLANWSQSDWSDLAGVGTRLRFYACPGHPQIWQKSDQ